MNVPPSKKARVQIATQFKDVFKEGTAYICRLAYASAVEIGDGFESAGAVRIITDAADVYMPMKELVDLSAELERLKKELKKAEGDREFFEKKLSNEGFVKKAPAAVVEQQREQLARVLEKIKLLENSIRETERSL